ncbi:MAG: ABC transporter ATP-binding protein [Ruminococcus sp.]|nr:ABC transporter ATP-binding protein [Ruminococcus sp.]
MIEIRNLTKKFDKLTALNNISFNVSEGSVVGLVGSNGSGKSTLLRVLSGVYQPDGGEIIVDGQELFDNYIAKGECYFIPDFPYFYNNSTLENTAFLYRKLYPNWSEEIFNKFCSVFPINRKQRIINMSKGMQRQAALILALSTCPKYLFLDEIFDGLDPVVRHLLKKILIDAVCEKGVTVIIASHNLRELEDLCDRVCLMHMGNMLMESDIDALRQKMRKVQVAFTQIPQRPNLFEGINVVDVWQNGNVFNLTIRGTEESFMPQLNALEPAYISALPLTLEEIFISEMEVAGYDISNIVKR